MNLVTEEFNSSQAFFPLIDASHGKTRPDTLVTRLRNYQFGMRVNDTLIYGNITSIFCHNITFTSGTFTALQSLQLQSMDGQMDGQTNASCYIY